MAFIVKDVPEITVDVEIRQPGRAEPDVFQATWKLHKRDARRAREEEMRNGDLSDEQLIERDLVSISEVRNEAGEPLTALQLLQYAHVERPLILSWFKAQECREASAQKN